jgi:putative oxidoreductase
MKKIAPAIAGILLGLVFLMASVTYLMHVTPPPPPTPPPADVTTFMTLFSSTGYFTVVKVFELIGGLLVMIPFTRNLGLLILGPIIVNILTFTFCIGGGFQSLNNPMSMVMMTLTVVLPLYLLWVERRAFAGLIQRVR